jgi:hypothetical protein
MPSIKRTLPALAAAALLTGLAAPAALASTNQEALIQDDSALAQNTQGTLQTMRDLGATRVKVAVYWSTIAPEPGSSHAPRFDATDPSAYPAGNWNFLDSVVRQAQADGLQVGFEVTGPAPAWAIGQGVPRSCGYHPCGQWKPNAQDFGQFVQALGRRYSGGYTPLGQSSSLPRVDWWSIWNEPNYGPDLAPQATNNNTVPTAAIEYRGLLDAAWSGLARSGHNPRRDRILIGETAPRGRQGRGFPGDFSGTMPITFIKALYCVGNSLKPLRGRAATRWGCPSDPRRFRSQNPALFSASGYAQHPYAQGTPPNLPTYACGSTFCVNPRTRRSDPNYADFAELPRLERLLDSVNRAYGSRTRFPIWNTEYGFRTNPPEHARGTVSPATAGYYMNWAEYLSYKQPRIASYSQYLLVDPPDGFFASGLILAGGTRLANFAAYQMPIYMPTTSVRRASRLEVWGAVRPAEYALSDTGLRQQAQIQFQPGGRGAFATVQTVTITSTKGYFDARQVFTRSGNVRIAWSRPGADTIYSRTQAVRVG